MSLKDIAEKAGVSSSTVSRVLSNPNYRCNDKKLRDKIIRIAMEQNYVPNTSARQLKSGDVHEQAYHVHVLMTRMADPFFVELLHTVQTCIHDHGCILSHVFNRPIFSHSERLAHMNMDRIRESLDEECEESSKEGLVILGKCDVRIAEMLKKEYQAVVLISRNTLDVGIDEVFVDGAKVAEMAIDYLCEEGYREIAYVGETHQEARFAGYLAALEKHDLAYREDYVIKASASDENGLKAYQRLAVLKNPPQAIYFANDVCAIGLLRYLDHKKRNYYVPSIIGSDDVEEASFTSPMLTTIHLPIDEMGRMAIGLLIDRLKKRHKGPIRCELSGHLVVRTSVKKIYNR